VQAELNKLQNAVTRNEELIKVGAISASAKQDADDALASAKTQLQAAQYDEDSTYIKAPYAGVILSKSAETGDTINPAQPILTIADTHSLLIAKVMIPNRAVDFIDKNKQVKINVNDNVYLANIRRIGSLSDTKTATVTVELVLKSDAPLASSTIGEAIFSKKELAQNSTEFLLPPEALIESKDNKGYIFTLDDKNSIAVKTEVDIAGFSGEFIRIRGVNANVKVITSGAGFVSNGQNVEEIK
jgi:RND family efflux transporter MFP subunit